MTAGTITIGKRRVVVEKPRRAAMGLDGQPNRSRYGVVSKERRTIDGQTFDSGREAKRYAELCLLERAGEITDLEIQPVFPVAIAGKPFCRYTADFSYRDRDGRFVVEDVKSSGTAKDAAYRLRKKAAELAYSITVTEVLR
jgi:hypothetical protein